MWFGPNVKLHQNGGPASSTGGPTHPYPHLQYPHRFSNLCCTPPLLLLTSPIPCIESPTIIILPVCHCKRRKKPASWLQTVVEKFRNTFLLGWDLYNSDQKMTGCFALIDAELLVY